MKVRGSVAPTTAFSIEQQPNNPGYILTRFYENVRPYTETRDDGTLTGFEYDEYTLELLATSTIEDDIFNQYDMYMEQAKLRELNSQPYDPAQNKQQQEQADQARADIDFIAAMTGVDLV